MAPLPAIARNGLRFLVRPLVRFCVRNAISIQEIEKAIRAELVNVVVGELEERKVKVSISKVAAVTGLHRREVSRLIGAAPAPSKRVGISARVLNTWLSDEKYRTKKGGPRVLSVGSGSVSFRQLVNEVAPEASAKYLLEHFLNSGIVEKTRGGFVPVRAGYAPDSQPEEYFEMLGLDLEDMIAAVSENAFENPRFPNLHHTTEYTALRASAYDEIREWLLDEGARFHHRVRRYLAQFDQSVGRSPGERTEESMKISLTTVSYTVKSDTSPNTSSSESEQISGEQE